MPSKILGIGVRVCAVAQVWKSEEYFGSIHIYMGSRDQTQVIRFAQQTLTC